MIIVMKRGASEKDLQRLLKNVQEWGLKPNVSRGTERTVIGLIGDDSVIAEKPIDVMPGVESVMRVLKPYKLASSEHHPQRTRITIPPARKGDKPLVFGGKEIVFVAGPCSVETRETMMETAKAVKRAGARALRAGAFKPRTSPYAFQGLGVEGLRLLAEVRAETGLPIITEVMDTRDVEMVAEAADIMQVGARNVQNYNLLKAVGRTTRPVLLKRGMASTLEELLMSAEYIMSQGNANVILCERGIRTFEKFTRNTLDLNAVPVLKRESHLPVAVDPSHGTGYRDLVAPMALASVAAGADSIMVEVHPQPEKAWSDGSQTLSVQQFESLMKQCRAVAKAVGRSV
ncbi:MAG TPA: 3-deoxy-7-phosphoheptulonate synthase [Kiritimatiellia bacterium]